MKHNATMPGSPAISLLRDARAGDLHAFEQLVRQYQAQVYGLALQLAGEPSGASELAQDAFIRLHSALPRIASPAHLVHWLLRTVSQRAGNPATAEPEELLRRAAAEADPGADFTARVLARVQLRRSHRRVESAPDASASRSQRSRIILISVLAILGIAALLALWPSGTLRQPLITAGAANDTVASSGPPEKAATSANPEDSAKPSAAAQAPEDTYPYYSVIVLPARRSAQDSDSGAAVEAFRTALLAELRKVPDLEVLIPGVTAPPDLQRPADYLLTVTSLDAITLPSGNIAFHMTQSRSGTSIPVPSTANPEIPAASRQWPVQLTVQPLSQPASASFTSTVQISRDSNLLNQLAATQVEMLRRRAFPDALVKQQLTGRMRDGSLNTVERDQALADLLGTQRARGQGLDASDVGAIVERAVSMNPEQRAQLWRNLRGNSHPYLLQPLIDYMRRDPDGNVRFEALATLAADYGTEPRARAAIESASRDDPDEVVRMAARRTLHGDAEWRAYLIATLRNPGLPYAERLAPLLRTGRSASTPSETLGMQALLNDQGNRHPAGRNDPRQLVRLHAGTDYRRGAGPAGQRQQLRCVRSFRRDTAGR